MTTFVQTVVSRPLITWTRVEKPGSSLNANNERERFFISTDPRFLSIKAINAAFDSPFMYWAKAIDETLLKAVLDGAFCLGVYRYVSTRVNTDQPNEDSPSGHDADADRKEVESLQPSEVQQIGLARIITDNVTFAYLTDVYILPEYQNKGLGSWLIECVADTWSTKYMPHLRGVMLYTSHQEKWYEKLLGMRVVGSEAINGADGGLMLSIMSGRGRREPKEE